MINNINCNNVGGINPNGVQKQPSKSVDKRGDVSDATVQVKYDSLVSQAADSDVDVQGVQKARQLMQAGQLDTPENIREAATNMVQYGI